MNRRIIASVCAALTLVLWPSSSLAEPPGSPESHASPEETKDTEEDPDYIATEFYEEGKERLGNIDYEGALESFSRALRLAEDSVLRSELMLNIASTHVAMYKIDENLAHLRRAEAVYQRHLEKFWRDAKYPESHAERSRKSLHTVRVKLDAARRVKEEKRVQSPPPPPPAKVLPKLILRKRKVGVVVLSSGVVSLIGGVGLIAAGTTFKPRAQQQVRRVTMGDPTHPDAKAGQDHIDKMTRRGVGYMVAGGVVGTAGLVGVIVGGSIVKSTRLQLHALPSASAGYAGITFLGRF